MNELDLFTDALARTDLAERAAFLDEACAGNPDLRRRLDVLLTGHARDGSPLDRLPIEPGGSASGADVPASLATADFDPNGATGTFGGTPHSREHSPAATSGTVIAGRYTLVEVIGEGGMGSVYLATQSEPVKRQVALKLIKTGMDTKAVLARFDAERQALARMDHPNIARIYDGGVTPAGQPFFVMELVKGVPLTEYCDVHRLSVGARLLLFVAVCQAVQHAHQKGIIHRDLKPSNVLVTEVDGRPTPKVIDFGVAKATELRLTDQSFADTGAIVGTPAYMSPEQADPSSMDIDTRTDVYALGVVLYELLTGSPPIDASRFKRGAVLEMLRMVREVEPPRPSTRLSTANARSNVAANRSIEPAKLAKLLQGELDWVVMKALEKDRTRRYDTANGFARDIQRYLADEVVEARPPSAGYRLKKFVTRHKGQVLAANLVLLTLVGGVVGTTIGLFAANAAADKERTANAAAQAARTEAETAETKEREAKVEAQNAAVKEKEAAAGEKAARAREATQRSKAEKARDRTRDVLDAMVSEVTGDSLTTQKEIGAEQKKFLEGVLGYYREFVGENADDERSRARHAQAAYRVSRIEYRLGRNEESAAAGRIARDGYASLAAEFPAVPAYRSDLAMSHGNLGNLLADLGQRAGAEEQYRKGMTIFAQLAAEFPAVPAYHADLAKGHNNLGNLLKRLGRGAGAEEQYRKGMTIFAQLAAEFPAVPAYRSDLAKGHTNLGNLLASLDQHAGAEEQYRKGMAIQEKLAAEFPTVPEYRQGLARSHTNLGNLLASLDQHAGAEEQYRKGMAIQEKLAAEFPAVPEYRQVLATSHGNLGILLTRLGRGAGAEEQYRKVMAIFAQLAAEFPAVPEYRQELAKSHTNLGILHKDLGQRAAAEEQYRKGMTIFAQLAASFPAVPAYRQELARSHNHLGNLLASLGRRAEAEEQYRKGMAIQEKLAAEFPAVPAYRRDLAGSHSNLGGVLAALGQRAGAEEQYRKGLAIREKLAAEFPAVPAYRSDLAMSHNHLGILLDSLGRGAGAEEQYRKGLAIREKLAAEFPAVPMYRVELGGSYCNLGHLIRDGGNHAESLNWYGRAIDCLRPVHEKEPRDVTAKQFLRNSHWARAGAHDRLQKFAEAVKDWDRAIALSPPAEQPSARASRATSLVNAGVVAEAVAEVAELTKSPNWNVGQWYNFARVYAVASGKLADKKPEYADRAMELLQTTVKAGWKDAAHMTADTALDPLRDREDFKALLADLEKRFPPPPPVAPPPRAKK